MSKNIWNAKCCSCIHVIIITSEMILIVFSAKCFQAIFEKILDLMPLMYRYYFIIIIINIYKAHNFTIKNAIKGAVHK
jgi:hypothetical protein